MIGHFNPGPRKVFSLILLPLFVFPLALLAGKTQDDITIGNKVVVRSEVLDEDRPLYVYLPKDYDTSNEDYPVLYLLDGEWHFHHVSGIFQFRTWAKMKPDMIVVAVVNTRRGRDFSPSTWPGYNSYTGGADNFNSFLEDELIPYIDRNYRTSSYKVLAGHSLAGTFTLYSFFARPDLFDAYISLSPCLFWHERFMLIKAEEFLKEFTELDKILYISHEYTEGSPASTMKEFVEAMKDRAPRGLRWTSLLKDKDDHFTFVHKAIYDGLDFIFLE